jgi:heme/copper-type cytochrome/quinol oxidase subunit 2
VHFLESDFLFYQLYENMHPLVYKTFNNGYPFRVIFDSNLSVPEENTLELQSRYLRGMPFLILPAQTYIKFIVTADDVAHSFAIPSFGVKVDAIPGRLNDAVVFFNKRGLYEGQCSEICGSGHALMPITIVVLDKAEYVDLIHTTNQLQAQLKGTFTNCFKTEHSIH